MTLKCPKCDIRAYERKYRYCCWCGYKGEYEYHE